MISQNQRYSLWLLCIIISIYNNGINYIKLYNSTLIKYCCGQLVVWCSLPLQGTLMQASNIILTYRPKLLNEVNLHGLTRLRVMSCNSKRLARQYRKHGCFVVFLRSYQSMWSKRAIFQAWTCLVRRIHTSRFACCPTRNQSSRPRSIGKHSIRFSTRCSRSRYFIPVYLTPVILIEICSGTRRYNSLRFCQPRWLSVQRTSS